MKKRVKFRVLAKDDSDVMIPDNSNLIIPDKLEDVRTLKKFKLKLFMKNPLFWSREKILSIEVYKNIEDVKFLLFDLKY